MERILIYQFQNKLKMLRKIKKLRKILITIYLIVMLFIIIMFFRGLTDESLQPVVTEMIKGYNYTLCFTIIIFSVLEYIYRKR